MIVPSKGSPNAPRRSPSAGLDGLWVALFSILAIAIVCAACVLVPCIQPLYIGRYTVAGSNIIVPASFSTGPCWCLGPVTIYKR